ncbi:MAG: TetR family transcriptional regulator [Anaerolineales bacterium]|nr:TetR family transcriptional regulator [Anaerolineales bacterium]
MSPHKEIHSKPPIRERIRQAALACFGRNGYKGATIAQIASTAGVNPAVIYRHFDSKRALFESLERPELDFPNPAYTERRQEIARAALAVFSQQGFTAATMEQVAESANLSKGGLYAYFDSKEALFEAALDAPRAFVLVDGAFQEALQQHNADAETCMRHIAQGYLAMFDNPNTIDLMRIVVSEGVRDEAIASLFLDSVVRRGSQRVSAYLERLGYGSRKRLERKVQAFFGMLFSWALTHRLLAQSLEPIASDMEGQISMAETAVELFFHGLKKRPNLGDNQ